MFLLNFLHYDHVLKNNIVHFIDSVLALCFASAHAIACHILCTYTIVIRDRWAWLGCQIDLVYLLLHSPLGCLFLAGEWLWVELLVIIFIVLFIDLADCGLVALIQLRWLSPTGGCLLFLSRSFDWLHQGMLGWLGSPSCFHTFPQSVSLSCQL